MRGAGGNWRESYTYTVSVSFRTATKQFAHLAIQNDEDDKAGKN
jgi:hypothetical protein